MQVKELIKELQKYGCECEVLIYKGAGDLAVIKKDNIEFDELTEEVILT